MSFKVRIEQNTHVIAIELKDGRLGYSKSIGNSQFAHTPLTLPFAIDFPNLQHGYVKFEKGKQAEFVLRSYQEEWTDEEDAAMRADHWQRAYVVPAASRELPADQQQELRITKSAACAMALSDCHTLYVDATESVNGMIPLVQHEIDHLGNQSFQITRYVPRPVKRFGEPLVKQVIPFPKAAPKTTPNDDLSERLKQRVAASKKANDIL